MKNKVLQKEIFLNSEADQWFERNKQSASTKDFKSDAVCAALLKILRTKLYDGRSIKILEVGCGEGSRLMWLSSQTGAVVNGVDPSKKAIAAAIKKGVDAIQGTADSLPYSDGSFDILIFGFCLYLCDQEDLFKIAHEANRVLKQDAWLIISDFYSAELSARDYHHKAGLYSHKMDYRKLFDWHPSYTCYAHHIEQHGRNEFCDDPQEWVATSTLRKRLRG